MADTTADAWIATAVVAVLGSLLHEAADVHWSPHLGISPVDAIQPSLVLGAIELGAASSLPTPFKRGFIISGAMSLITQLSRWKHSTDLFPLVVIAVLIAVGLAYAASTGAPRFQFASHFNSGYGF
jgi:hypothetical protein